MLRTTMLWPVIASVASAAVALPCQVAWHQVSSGSNPTVRMYHAVASSPGGLVLMFGGLAPGFAALDDTWLFDGVAWTEAQPVTRPPHRVGHRLAHDVARGRTVLFGGNIISTFLNDTWEWDGTDWLLRQPAHRPIGRVHCSMAFDLPRFRTVLFGGGGAGLLADDTWEWDGVDWTQVMTATAPSPRFGAGLAADIARGRLVLFGGKESSSGAVRNDTWEYDGQDWHQRQSITTPPARHFQGFDYDVRRQRTVMFGGAASGFGGDSSDTWEWDGSDWRQRLPSGQVPTARRATAIAYDMGRGIAVLFGGGVGGNNALFYADTFTYAPTTPATYSAYGVGCAGTAGVPALLPVDGRAPWIGDSWGLQLAQLPANTPAFVLFGISRTAWGPTRLPMPLIGYGLPGCTLLVSPEVCLLTVATAQFATWPIAIPSNQALLGVTMFAQGAGMDLAANAGGLVVGNALEVAFGGR